jgi:hypothetical protein
LNENSENLQCDSNQIDIAHPLCTRITLEEDSEITCNVELTNVNDIYDRYVILGVDVDPNKWYEVRDQQCVPVGDPGTFDCRDDCIVYQENQLICNLGLAGGTSTVIGSYGTQGLQYSKTLTLLSGSHEICVMPSTPDSYGGVDRCWIGSIICN